MFGNRFNYKIKIVLFMFLETMNNKKCYERKINLSFSFIHVEKS